jgi:hypothetical protein
LQCRIQDAGIKKQWRLGSGASEAALGNCGRFGDYGSISIFLVYAGLFLLKGELYEGF